MITLEAGLDRLGISSTSFQKGLWSDYLDLLIKWNKVYNLTAIRSRESMVVRHILDSLSIAPHLSGCKLLDIGAGAGLPSIPLAILWPDCEFVALDSNGKKVRFMQQAAFSLKLPNFTAVQSRVEDWEPVALFDGILSRAFSSLEDMILASEHLLAVEGTFWAMKGRIDPEELSALPKPFKVNDCLPLQVPDDPADRHLLVIRRSAD